MCDPWVGRSPGEGNGYPLQFSGLENSRDYIVHGVAKSWTQLSDSHFTYRVILLLFFFFFKDMGDYVHWSFPEKQNQLDVYV